MMEAKAGTITAYRVNPSNRFKITLSLENSLEKWRRAPSLHVARVQLLTSVVMSEARILVLKVHSSYP